MAENKKSFVLYADLLHTFKHLNLKQRGQVITWVLEYVNDKNPEPLTGLLSAVCEPIKLQLKRDLVKYEIRKTQWSEAGKKSAEARIKKKRNSTDVEGRSTDLKVVQHRSTKSTVNVNDTVNVNTNDIKKRKAEFKNSLRSFLPVTDKETLNEFFEYWSEHNENGKKMRFEYTKNQPFNKGRRLATWMKKEKNFAPKKEKTINRQTEETIRRNAEPIPVDFIDKIRGNKK